MLHGRKEREEFGQRNRTVVPVSNAAIDLKGGSFPREATREETEAVWEARERKAVGVGAAGDEFFIENIADHSSTTFSNAEFMRVQGAEGRWAIGSG